LNCTGVVRKSVITPSSRAFASERLVTILTPPRRDSSRATASVVRISISGRALRFSNGATTIVWMFFGRNEPVPARR
jgi:hypothetical protein